MIAQMTAAAALNALDVETGHAGAVEKVEQPGDNNRPDAMPSRMSTTVPSPVALTGRSAPVSRSGPTLRSTRPMADYW
jgi:hypothetical protein